MNRPRSAKMAVDAGEGSLFVDIVLNPGMAGLPHLQVLDHEVAVFEGGWTHLVRRPRTTGAEGEQAGSGQLSAPMPGRIVSVSAAVGDEVKRGAAVVALEAMKMEHALTAPFDARVAEVAVAVGDQVVEGAVLARLEPL